jgi:hypothetical protein
VEINMTNPEPSGFSVRETYGEILPAGAAIELVLRPPFERIELLHYRDKEQFTTKSQVECGETLYHPPFLHFSQLEAVRFPSSVAEYGSAEELFTNMVKLLRDVARLDTPTAAAIALWIRSTWLADLYCSPPLLCIAGPHSLARQLFRLLRALCRRSLWVAELNLRLPFDLRPTLLIFDPGLSLKRQAQWQASNHRGIFIPDKRGTLRNLAGSKAVYLDQGNADDGWGPEALRLTLLPSVDSLPQLSEEEEERIAGEYQNQLLGYRLQQLTKSQSSSFENFEIGTESDLARNLLAGVHDAPKLLKAASPLLIAHAQELSARLWTDPYAVTIECLWGPAHESKEIASSQLLKRLNALLHSRGENFEYNARHLGWKLRQLGIVRGRNGPGKKVQFTSAVHRRVHALVRRFGLHLPRKENCRECAQAETNET